MKLLKPFWINHDGSPIFSIDIHPDDTRFVTGGQGSHSMGRVVIWNMASVLQLWVSNRENGNKEHKSVPEVLCQLDQHNACVNSVRWSNDGQYLASGGDDRTIIIWKLTSRFTGAVNAPSSTVFGKTSYEQWKIVAQLKNHVGDVLDLSWSPSDRYLASASVDNEVIIWDAQNFPRVITVIKGHASLVKGVTWDPIGKYIATQSDDRTLKIWRTSDWQTEHVITDPFVECSATTHVLRLAWSPDGQYLVSAHAMNGGGPTALIVERDGWKTDKDFVGHRKAIVCVRFSKSVMQQSRKNRVRQQCCVALGSRDRSISVWSTSLKRPVVVIKDIFTSSVMDISWSSCGTIMMACSNDGTVAVAKFFNSEIGKPLSSSEMMALHQRVYGKTAMMETCQVVHNAELFMARKNLQNSELVNSKSVISTNSPEKNLSVIKESPIKGPIDRQIETRTADGKRRITPKFLPSLENEHFSENKSALWSGVTGSKCDSAVFHQKESQSSLNPCDMRDNMVSRIEDVRKEGNEPSRGTGKDGNTIAARSDRNSTENVTNGTCEPPKTTDVESQGHLGAVNRKNETPTCNGVSDLEPSRHLTNGELVKKGTISLIVDESDKNAQGVCNNNSLTQAASGRKRKSSSETPLLDSEITKKSKTVVSSSVLEPQSRLNAQASLNQKATIPVSSTYRLASSRQRLPPLKIESDHSLLVSSKSVKYTLDVHNNRRTPEGSWNTFTCTHESTSLQGLRWSICTDAPICAISGDAHRIVLLCEDSTVHVLDVKGRYASPPLVITSYPSKMCQTGAFLLVVTVKGILHVWNIHTKKFVVKSESLVHLFTQQLADSTAGNASIDITHLSMTGTGVPLVALSNGKTFLFNPDIGTWMLYSDSRGVVSSPLLGVESHISGRKRPRKSPEATLTHIKLKLSVSIETRNTSDCRTWLIALAKNLATQELRQELHQLCEDLLGPTHATAIKSPWVSRIAGVDKRDVLREILRNLLDDLKWQDLFCEFNDQLERLDNACSLSSNIQRNVHNS